MSGLIPQRGTATSINEDEDGSVLSGLDHIRKFPVCRERRFEPGRNDGDGFADNISLNPKMSKNATSPLFTGIVCRFFSSLVMPNSNADCPNRPFQNEFRKGFPSAFIRFRRDQSARFPCGIQIADCSSRRESAQTSPAGIMSGLASAATKICFRTGPKARAFHWLPELWPKSGGPFQSPAVRLQNELFGISE